MFLVEPGGVLGPGVCNPHTIDIKIADPEGMACGLCIVDQGIESKEGRENEKRNKERGKKEKAERRAERRAGEKVEEKKRGKEAKKKRRKKRRKKEEKKEEKKRNKEEGKKKRLVFSWGREFGDARSACLPSMDAV